MARIVIAFALAFATCGAALVGGAVAAAPDAAPPVAPETPAPPLGVVIDAPPPGVPFYKWGVGWDAGRGFVAGGVAIRRRINDEWGLGFIIDANVSGGDDEEEDRDGNQNDDRSSTQEGLVTDDFTYDAFGLRAFAFHETRLTEWFALGPYFGLGYGFDRRDSDELRVSTRVTDTAISTERREVTSTNTAHSWAFSLGLRPSFTFDQRFVLETRLGFTGIWRDEETRRTVFTSEFSEDENGATESSTRVEKNRDDDDGWSFTAFGQELGPGAVLSFIVCF